jgi:LETM1 and EF-hand domain-containing protein 1, mitochondrial
VRTVIRTGFSVRLRYVSVVCGELSLVDVGFARSGQPRLGGSALVRGYGGVRGVSTETRGTERAGFPPLGSQKQQQESASQAAPPTIPLGTLTDPPTKLDLGKRLSAEEVKDAITAEGEMKVTSPTENTALDKKSDKKLTIWQKVKKEAVHYWDGTKLLGKEIRISFRLALKMAAGYELSRRESRQLKRTTEDLIRLVPFSVFVIVPFAELLLPVALKLFPNMLPSTYEGEKAKEAKRAALSKTRRDVSNFLRTTIQESGFHFSKATKQSEEFAEFFRKVCLPREVGVMQVRTSGICPSDEEVIAISKIFRDDLTLDNLSRAQLIAMSRYMNLNTFGTDTLLRYQLRHHLRQIKRDDKAIAYEGVNSLSVPELQYATAARGIRSAGVSPGRLRDDLQQWLELRLKHGIPSTLLVLSNAYAYGQDNQNSHIDNLRTTLSCLSDELVLFLLASLTIVP